MYVHIYVVNTYILSFFQGGSSENMKLIHCVWVTWAGSA